MARSRCSSASATSGSSQNFEKGPAKEWVGPSGEARLRQFLAAERFAERMGWKASELRSLPELDSLPARGVLLLPNGRQALGGERLGTILGWVARGGHLIAEAEARGVPDPLFDLMEIARRRGARGDQAARCRVAASGRRLTVSMPGAMKLVLRQTARSASASASSSFPSSTATG